MLEPFVPDQFKPIADDQRTFIVIPYRALKDKGFTIQRMRALLACCSYANHKGTLWPSIERLAEDMGISKATMQAHVKWLTEKGYLMTVNNSYTVGKSAKPRAVVYDETNPPNSDDQGELAKDYEAQVNDRKSIKDEKLRLLQPEQSSNEELAKPASLYQCYRSLLLSRFGADLPYQKEIWLQISHRHTLETFKEAASMLINSKNAPPSSPRIFLK
jgi:DNA-binding transcriptional regulator YhcF (GntR family)